MKKLILLSLLLIGCVPRSEIILSKINDDVNYNTKGNCRAIAERKVEVLKQKGIKAEIIHCDSRSKYEPDHAIVKATIDGKEYTMDSIDPVVWEYEEVKKATYDYILP